MAVSYKEPHNIHFITECVFFSQKYGWEDKMTNTYINLINVVALRPHTYEKE